jgi:hypothetical protein
LVTQIDGVQGSEIEPWPRHGLRESGFVMSYVIRREIMTDRQAIVFEFHQHSESENAACFS